MIWKTAFVPPRLAAPVTSASFKLVFAASVNSWTYPRLPNVFTFPSGGITTSELKPLRFQAAWNTAMMASVGAPAPTVTSVVSVTVAVALLVVSETLVAVTVIFWLVAISPGAVYNPFCVIDPTDGLIVHTTSSVAVFRTVAVNCTDCPFVSEAVAGESEIVGAFN